MAREIIFYQQFHQESAEWLVGQLRQDMSEDVLIRLNSQGGGIGSGHSVSTAMAERTGKTSIVVDGYANSYGATMLVFADTVSVTNLSSFMLHLAHSCFPLPEAAQKSLDGQNEEILRLLKRKLNSTPEAVGILTKFTEGEDVFFDGKMALKIGLADSFKEIEASMLHYEAIVSFDPNLHKIINEKKEKMNIDELKKKHPELYVEMIALGGVPPNTLSLLTEEETRKEERDRISMLDEHRSLLPEEVKLYIDSGKTIDVEFMKKVVEAQSNGAVKETMERLGIKDTEGNAGIPPDGDGSISDEELKAEYNETVSFLKRRGNSLEDAKRQALEFPKYASLNNKN